MDERRALMAAILAIIANPDEDTPRLALADWLQEHGDKHDRARAEFIRLQVEAARLPRGDEARAKLRGRADAIDRAHAKHWLGPLMGLVSGPYFERGMLDVRFFTPAAFAKPETQRVLAEWVPRVGARRLVLGGKTKRVGLVAGSPVLGLVPALEWWDTQMDDDGLKALAKSPHTGGLTALTLEKLLASDAGLKALARSPNFAALRKLRLLAPVHGGPGISAAGIRALIASDKLPRLDTFALTAAFRVGLESFCNEPALSRLKSLYVRAGRPFAALCRCRHLTGLDELLIDSYSGGMLDVDAFELLDNPAFAKLRRLIVSMPTNRDLLSETALHRLRARFGDGFSTDPDRLHE
jgi:uncharacterized protein (TIGR02996 family)